jgi:hypothetical protein
MANKIKLKNSSVVNKAPAATDLEYGELALNYADGKLYYKKSNGTTIDYFSSDARAPGVSSSTSTLDFKTYTATATQTIFNVTYTVPYVNVYVNGVLLSNADYTATSGTNVVLASSSLENDIVNLIGFTSLEIIPSQTGNSGKFLTTNGTNVSWASTSTRVVDYATTTSITINADTTDMATTNNAQGAGGTFTINAPTTATSIANGQKLMLRMTTSAVQTLSFDPTTSVFRFSTDLPRPIASSGGGKEDYMGFIYDSSAGKWDLIAKNFGF